MNVNLRTCMHNASHMHLHVHITNEKSEAVIYTDYASPVTVKSLRPCIKDSKEKEYTENFGSEDNTKINIREIACVRMVGNGTWLRIISNGWLYLPPASCLAVSRALFTTCLLLRLLFNSEGGNLFLQNVWLFQTTRHYNPEECTCHLQMRQQACYKRNSFNVN